MLSKIIVPLDGSDLSERALDYARQVISPTGEIVLINVVDVPDFPIYTVYPMPIAAPEPDYSAVITNMLDGSREYVEKIAENLRLSGHRVKTVVESGEPAVKILEQATQLEADAIVMSTHGRSGLSKWLFGSVTQKVLSAMPCPVIVVPGLQRHVNDPKTEAQTEKV